MELALDTLIEWTKENGLAVKKTELEFCKEI